MSKSVENKRYPFEAADQLLLQQLATRQFLASAETVDSRIREENEMSDSDVRLWKLIPDKINLYDWQKNCLTIWMESLNGTVKIATGGGKTLFALAAAQALQNQKEPDLRLAIVVPTIPLMHQWLDELRDSNIPPSQIALLGGGETPSDDPEIRIVISVINSARDHLPKLVKKNNWSSKLLLVVDECHRANASMAKRIFNSNPTYTLGLSATPEVDEGDSTVPTNDAYAKSDVGKALGPIIFEFSLKESLDAGLLTPFEVCHVGLPLNPTEATEYLQLSREITELRKDLQAAHRRSKSKQNFIAWCQTIASRKGSEEATRFIGLANERKRLLYRSEARAELTLQVLASTMHESDSRAIVFHESINEINTLFLSATSKELPAVLEHSKLPSPLRASNIDAFRTGVAKIIISAKSLVEGFNVPSADIGIIAASSGSVRQRIQSLGRMLRKNSTGRKAIIFVFYIKDTEDESIYQKADWEAVIGAERNRYFEWDSSNSSNRKDYSLDQLLDSLSETGTPPREYRPPCHEIDITSLATGDVYLGQTTGTELKVDQNGNLKTNDGELAAVPSSIIENILSANQYRRAVRTPCGHLICRTTDGDRWIYLGSIEAPTPPPQEDYEKLSIKSFRGTRVISRKKGRSEIFARGPDKATSKESGQTTIDILNWVQEQEKNLSTQIREFFWDGNLNFWIEVGGKRIKIGGIKSRLEFPN